MMGEDWTRSQITNAINGGRILVNGEVVKAGRILRKGDVITSEMQGSDLPAEPEDIPLDIVFEDEYLLVINKPRGMVVHPGAGVRSGTVLNALLWRGSSIERAGIVHRLDKNTAGLMVVAKTAKVQSLLARMFEFHDVQRTYVGLVEGRVEEGGTIRKNLKRHPGVRTLYTTCNDWEGRTAVTHFRPLEVFKKHSKIEFKLETGRTHQIRVHMKSINRPLIGDAEYNPKSSIKASGQMLEAVRLEFSHPITGKPMKFTINPTEEFKSVENRLTRI